jgi:hypothetical protein
MDVQYAGLEADHETALGSPKTLEGELLKSTRAAGLPHGSMDVPPDKSIPKPFPADEPRIAVILGSKRVALFMPEIGHCRGKNQ